MLFENVTLFLTEKEVIIIWPWNQQYQKVTKSNQKSDYLTRYDYLIMFY